MAQAERKPVVEPDSTGDDFWWETMVFVIGDGLVHAHDHYRLFLKPKQSDIPVCVVGFIASYSAGRT
jgi:hypothetical protein